MKPPKQPENVKRVLDFVRTSIELVTARLQAAGIAAEEAGEIAQDCVHDITESRGRTWMYVPAHLDLALTRRDKQIVADFNGRNVLALAEQHHLTHTRIRQILARARYLDDQARLKDLADRQHALPGLEDADEPQQVP